MRNTETSQRANGRCCSCRLNRRNNRMRRKKTKNPHCSWNCTQTWDA